MCDAVLSSEVYLSKNHPPLKVFFREFLSSSRLSRTFESTSFKAHQITQRFFNQGYSL